MTSCRNIIPVCRERSVFPGGRTFSRFNRGYIFLLIFIAAVIQINAGADEADSRALNWAYQSSLGDGFFASGSEYEKIYKVPFSYTLRDFTENNWPLKLKFPLTVGVYRIEAGNDNIDLDIMALVPGIELQMKLRDNWILVPAASLGIGKDTSGGGVRYLYSAGIKNYFLFLKKNLETTFGNGLRYDGYRAGGGISDHVPSFNTGLDVRFPLGLNLLKNPGYLSFYTVFYHYFNGVIVIDAEEKKLRVENQLELGFTLGTVPVWKLWKLPIERAGIGFRFGDGFKAVRLTFGMPF